MAKATFISLYGESLRYCDIACRGEAEEAIVELADSIDKGKGPKGIKNLLFKEDGRIIENGIRPPYKNLDELPFQDTEPEGNYFVENNTLYESPKFLFPSPNLYSTITARSCIFQRSYCCELYLKDLYKGHNFLRRRSPQNIIEELKQVKNRHNINYIIFQDEIISYQTEWLKEFAPLYKERLELLKEAGLSSTCLAVQSGSEQLFDCYAGLLWVSSYFKGSRALVNIIKSVGMFERCPALLKPVLYVCSFFGSLNKNIYKLKKIAKSGRLNAKFVIGFIKRKFALT